MNKKSTDNAQQNTKADDALKMDDAQSNQAQEYDVVGGVACPVDPMERLQCESCQ